MDAWIQSNSTNQPLSQDPGYCSHTATHANKTKPDFFVTINGSDCIRTLVSLEILVRMIEQLVR